VLPPTCISIGLITGNNDVIHKTTGTEKTAMLPEEYQDTATGNTQRKFDAVWTRGYCDTLADR